MPNLVFRFLPLPFRAYRAYLACSHRWCLSCNLLLKFCFLFLSFQGLQNLGHTRCPSCKSAVQILFVPFSYFQDLQNIPGLQSQMMSQLQTACSSSVSFSSFQGLQNIPGLQSHMKTQLQQLFPKPPISSSGESPLSAASLQPTTTTTTTTSTAAITLGPDGDALPIDPSAGRTTEWLLLFSCT